MNRKLLFFVFMLFTTQIIAGETTLSFFNQITDLILNSFEDTNISKNKNLLQQVQKIEYLLQQAQKIENKEKSRTFVDLVNYQDADTADSLFHYLVYSSFTMEYSKESIEIQISIFNILKKYKINPLLQNSNGYTPLESSRLCIRSKVKRSNCKCSPCFINMLEKYSNSYGKK